MLKVYLSLLALCAFVVSDAKHVDYTGHKVIRIVPKSEAHLELLHKLRLDYGVDLWNEPRIVDLPVMVHLRPQVIDAVEEMVTKAGIEFDVAFPDLENVIQAERIQNAPTPTNINQAGVFDFGKYNQYKDVIELLKGLAKQYPNIASLNIVGKSFENRPIYSMQIGGGSNKSAIMMECGVHAREWSSVAACSYLVNRLITTYNSDDNVKNLVNKYEINIIVESNPDGYVYTWERNRLWRKTRSRINNDVLGMCRGVDANRNFDIKHCGVGTSNNPCEDIYCGPKPFSESEARAIRDSLISLGSRVKAYFSIHAFSQLWMTPYGTVKSLPSNYAELQRIGQIGATALSKKYGTQYRVGSIANIIYEAAGSSVDYAYVKHNVKIAYALELRDRGQYGFFLPQPQILPMCEETYDGLLAAIAAL